MEKESKGGETFSSMLEKVRSRGERKLQTLRQRAERATLKYQQAEKFLETLRASRNLFSGTSSSSTVDLAGEEGGDKEK